MFNKEQLKKTPVLSPENGETQESEVEEVQNQKEKQEKVFGPIQSEERVKENKEKLEEEIAKIRKSLDL